MRKIEDTNIYRNTSAIVNVVAYMQGRRENSEAPGQKRQMRSPASETSSTFSGSTN